MVKFRTALGLAAWALVLAPTVASGAGLDKYRTLSRPPPADFVKRGVVPYQVPSSKQLQPGATRLFDRFSVRVKALSPEEKTKLFGDFREKQKIAYGEKDYSKAEYYGQLLNIILKDMNRDTQ